MQKTFFFFFRKYHTLNGETKKSIIFSFVIKQIYMNHNYTYIPTW